MYIYISLWFNVRCCQRYKIGILVCRILQPSDKFKWASLLTEFCIILKEICFFKTLGGDWWVWLTCAYFCGMKFDIHLRTGFKSNCVNPSRIFLSVSFKSLSKMFYTVEWKYAWLFRGSRGRKKCVLSLSNFCLCLLCLLEEWGLYKWCPN